VATFWSMFFALALGGVVRRVGDGRIPVAGLAVWIGALVTAVLLARYAVDHRHVVGRGRLSAAILGVALAILVGLILAVFGYVRL
jgi:hypothetical protein